jgi:hypothetical protein
MPAKAETHSVGGLDGSDAGERAGGIKIINLCRTWSPAGSSSTPTSNSRQQAGSGSMYTGNSMTLAGNLRQVWEGRAVVGREHRQHPGPARSSRWDLCSAQAAAATAAATAAAETGASRLQQRVYMQQKSANRQQPDTSIQEQHAHRQQHDRQQQHAHRQQQATSRQRQRHAHKQQHDTSRQEWDGRAVVGAGQRS